MVARGCVSNEGFGVMLLSGDPLEAEWLKSTEAFTPSQKKIYEAVKVQVDKIWDEYDTDSNGSLDRKEAKAFCKKAFDDENENDEDWDDATYTAVFADLDKTGEGTVQKWELHQLLYMIKEFEG